MRDCTDRQLAGTQQLQSKHEAIDWVARAHGLAPVIAAAADRTERERRIADDVIAAIDEAGIPRMLMPPRLAAAAPTS